LRTLLTAAVLTLSTILSLGSALLLTLTALEIVNPTLNLYTLFVYLIAASPSYFIMKTLLEILKPQTAIQKNKEGEFVAQPEQTQQTVVKESDQKRVEQQTAESTKPPQEVKTEEQKNVEKEEQSKGVTTIETKLETHTNPPSPQPPKGDKEGVNEGTIMIFTPLLNELKSIQNELNGLKSRLRDIKEKLDNS